MATPIPALGYVIPPNNPAGKQWWQDTLDSLHGRIVDIRNDLAVTVESLGEDATAQALALVTNSVGPHIEAAQAQIQEIVDLAAEADAILSSLQTAGIPATNVPVTATASFPAGGSAQTIIAALDSALAALSSATTTSLATLATQLAATELPLRIRGAAGNLSLLAGRAYRILAPGITLTLPAAPSAQDSIRIIDPGVLSPTATAALDRNGQTIMDLFENLTLDVTGIDFVVWFDGATWNLH